MEIINDLLELFIPNPNLHCKHNLMFLVTPQLRVFGNAGDDDGVDSAGLSPTIQKHAGNFHLFLKQTKKLL